MKTIQSQKDGFIAMIHLTHAFKHAFKHTMFIFFTLSALWATGCSQPADAAQDMDATANAKADASGKKATTSIPDKVVVYYFHNTRRCPTCKGIQQGIEETIEGKFSKDIEAGMLQFEELNMEEDANKKFVKEFQLSFSTMIVAAQQDGKTVKWENAGKVWDHAHAPNELKKYVEKTIRTYLGTLGRSI